MFYDVQDPNTFCSDIESLLNKNGLWILELSYLPLMLKNLTYDQICHEHVMYYTLTTFKKLVEKHKLKIIDFSLNEINGGSIEIVCAKKNSKHKIQYTYLLTSKGIEEKTKLTIEFLKTKTKEYETLKKEVEKLNEMKRPE